MGFGRPLNHGPNQPGRLAMSGIDFVDRVERVGNIFHPEARQQFSEERRNPPSS
jgi:hypothetical protein